MSSKYIYTLEIYQGYRLIGIKYYSNLKKAKEHTKNSDREEVKYFYLYIYKRKLDHRVIDLYDCYDVSRKDPHWEYNHFNKVWEVCE